MEPELTERKMSLRLHERLYLVFISLLPVLRPNVPVSSTVVHLCDFVFVGVVLAWVIALARRKAQVRWTRLYAPMAVYVIAMSASVVASADLQYSFVRLARKVYAIALATLTLNIVSSIQFMRRLAKAWLVGTAVTVIVGILGIALFYAGIKEGSTNLALGHYGSLPPGNYPRIIALYDGHAGLCNYLGVSFLILLVTRSLGWLNTGWFVALAAGILAVDTSTFSPGLGGILLTSGIWVWLHLRDSNHPLGHLALLSGVMASLAFLIAATIFPVTSSRQGFLLPLVRGYALPILHGQVNPSPRVLTWKGAFETFRQHPVFGIGLGAGADVAFVHYTSPSGVPTTLTDAHNVWLSVAARQGIFGLLAFGSIVLVLLKGIGPLSVKEAASVVIKTGLALAFFDAFLYQGLTGTFDGDRHLWVLIGLLAAAKEGLVDLKSGSLRSVRDGSPRPESS